MRPLDRERCAPSATETTVRRDETVDVKSLLEDFRSRFDVAPAQLKDWFPINRISRHIGWY